MEKNKKSGLSETKNGYSSVDIVGNGVFDRVIGGGTAVIRGKKPIFTESSTKRSADRDEIITDPLGSWTGVPDDPYDKPIQDADDL